MLSACPPPPPAIVTSVSEESESVIGVGTLTTPTLDQQVIQRIRDLSVSPAMQSALSDYWASLARAAMRQGITLQGPAIGAFPGETVSFIWTWSTGASLEVLFATPDEIEVTLFPAGADEREASFQTIDGAVNQTLGWLHGR